MSTRQLLTTYYTRRERPLSWRMRVPPAVLLTWAACLGACLTFWWVVITALLG
jgi:hypothetical protein